MDKDDEEKIVPCDISVQICLCSQPNAWIPKCLGNLTTQQGFEMVGGTVANAPDSGFESLHKHTLISLDGTQD